MAIDTRHDPPRIFAGVGTGHWGPLLTYSDDLGKSWTEPEEPPIGFPRGGTHRWRASGRSSRRPRSSRTSSTRVSSRTRSSDLTIAAQSFSLVEGLWNHPDRPSWVPGGGGACLHTVAHPSNRSQRPDGRDVGRRRLPDPRRRRELGPGESRHPGRHILPEDQRFPVFGQCVHKVAFHPTSPQRLFAQNHFGVYRSEDRGDSWMPIEIRAAEQLRIRARRPSAPTRYALLLPAPG